jgi:tetratricopeptide (TPR) repeat protein
MEAINPLTLPKGQDFKCELTGEQATIKAELCGVQYYYRSSEHKELDFAAIRTKIAPLEAIVRNPGPVATSEDRIKQRAQIEDAKMGLVEICEDAARAYLAAGNYEYAVPPALHALRYSMELYPEKGPRLVPAYLLLAESNLGLGRAGKTEEFLSMVQWTILQSSEESVGHDIRGRFHHNFGKLHRATGALDDALRELGAAIYHCALEYGPEHVLTSGAYFDLGDVFFLKNQVEPALASFDKVVDIWYKYFVYLRDETPEAEGREMEGRMDAFFHAAAKGGELGTDQALQNQVISQLTAIASKRRTVMGAEHIATGEVMYTLALLHAYLGDARTALSHARAAEGVYKKQLGDDHPSTTDLAAVLKWLSAAVLSSA